MVVLIYIPKCPSSSTVQISDISRNFESDPWATPICYQNSEALFWVVCSFRYFSCAGILLYLVSVRRFKTFGSTNVCFEQKHVTWRLYLIQLWCWSGDCRYRISEMELSLEGIDEMKSVPLYVVHLHTSACHDARIGLLYESFPSLCIFFRFLAVVGMLETATKNKYYVCVCVWNYVWAKFGKCFLHSFIK